MAWCQDGLLCAEWTHRAPNQMAWCHNGLFCALWTHRAGRAPIRMAFQDSLFCAVWTHRAPNAVSAHRAPNQMALCRDGCLCELVPLRKRSGSNGGATAAVCCSAASPLATKAAVCCSAASPLAGRLRARAAAMRVLCSWCPRCGTALATPLIVLQPTIPLAAAGGQPCHHSPATQPSHRGIGRIASEPGLP
jgi:hypothetical protein